MMATKSRHFAENASENSQKSPKLDLKNLGNDWTDLVDSYGQSLAFPRDFQRGLDEGGATTGRHLKG